MKSYLLTWNPKKWQWEDFEKCVDEINQGYFVDRNWTCRSSKAQAGDRFFFMRLGVEPKGIIGYGQFLGGYDKKHPHFDNNRAEKGDTHPLADIKYHALSKTPIISADYLKENFKFTWFSQSSGIAIPDNIAKSLGQLIVEFTGEEIITNKQEECTIEEGELRTITVRNYNRNPEARRKCLEHHGYICSVCGFNFENIYGELGKDYIQIHHIKTISSYGKKHKINPKKDLRPVCANCHVMLHRRKPQLSIKELKDIITP